MRRWRIAHAAAGVAGVLAFALSGQMMDAHDPPVRTMDDVTRMMFRSRHINLLFVSLLNALAAVYMRPLARPWWQRAGCASLLAALGLLAAAFVREPYSGRLDRTLTNPGVALAAIGVIFQAAAARPMVR